MPAAASTRTNAMRLMFGCSPLGPTWPEFCTLGANKVNIRN
jgi:hypothetical protein